MSYGYPPAGAPPVYRPPGMRPGPGMPPGGRPPRPAGGLLITGGVLAILQSSLFLLAGLVIMFAGLAGGSAAREIGFNRSEADVAALLGAATTLFSAMAITCASFSITSRPGWTIASGVLQIFLALPWLLGVVAGAEGHAGGGELAILVFFAILAMLPAIFTFLGVGQARRRRQWKVTTGG